MGTRTHRRQPGSKPVLLIWYGFLPRGIARRKSSVGHFAPARNQRSCTIALRCPRLMADQSFASAATHAGKLLSLKPCSAAQLPWSQADPAAAWPHARLRRFIAGRGRASGRESVCVCGRERCELELQLRHSAGPRPISINRQRQGPSLDHGPAVAERRIISDACIPPVRPISV